MNFLATIALAAAMTVSQPDSIKNDTIKLSYNPGNNSYMLTNKKYRDAQEKNKKDSKKRQKTVKKALSKSFLEMSRHPQK